MGHQKSKIRVGFTYDLKSEHLARGATIEEVAEFESGETIEAITKALIRLGFEVDPIGNIFNLVQKLSQGQRWDFVFNFAEGSHGLAREAQIPCLLDAYQIPYVFSDSSVLMLTHHKALCKQALQNSSVPTAPFFLVHNLKDLEECKLPFPLFVKPVAEGSGKGVSAQSLVTHDDQLYSQCKLLLEKFNQPVLVETYLSGAEYTVGMLGAGEHSRVLGVMEVHFTPAADEKFYSFEHKKEFGDHVSYRLADQSVHEAVARVALEAWKHLGCRDGGRIDIRMDHQNTPHFIEVNPLPGLAPGFSDLVTLAELNGMTYQDLIAEIVFSALSRIPPSELKKSLRDDAHSQRTEALAQI